MSLELHLRIVGVLQLLIAALHALLPRALHWRGELSRLSLVNRQIFVVHTLFIVLILVLFGLLSSLAPASLINPTPLAALVTGGLAVFWLLRLLVQFFIYDPRIWRGDPARTRIHVVFSFVWLYLTIIYAAALFRQTA